MSDQWEERAQAYQERMRMDGRRSRLDYLRTNLAAEFRAIDAEARKEGRREEREACAQLCEDESSQWRELSTAGFNVAGRCAAAIRARGEKE